MSSHAECGGART